MRRATIVSRAADFLGCDRGPRWAVTKKTGAALAPELMAHHAEGPWRIPEGARDLVRRARLHEVGTQGLVDTLLGRPCFEEEAPALR